MADAPQTGKHEALSSPLLSNKFYDIMKFIVQIVLPAFGTFYFALADALSLGNPGTVVAVVTAVDGFLGVLLGLTTVQYNKSDAKYDGVVNVTEDENGLKHASLELKNYMNPADVVNQPQITFKVNPSTPQQ